KDNISDATVLFWFYDDDWLPCTADGSAMDVILGTSAHAFVCFVDALKREMASFGWTRASPDGPLTVFLDPATAKAAIERNSDKWSLAALSGDAVVAALFVNGVYIEKPSTITRQDPIPQIILRGVAPLVGGPTIRFDELRVFNRRLTKNELDYVYQLELPGTT